MKKAFNSVFNQKSPKSGSRSDSRDSLTSATSSEQTQPLVTSPGAKSNEDATEEVEIEEISEEEANRINKRNNNQPLTRSSAELKMKTASNDQGPKKASSEMVLPPNAIATTSSSLSSTARQKFTSQMSTSSSSKTTQSGSFTFVRKMSSESSFDSEKTEFKSNQLASAAKNVADSLENLLTCSSPQQSEDEDGPHRISPKTGRSNEVSLVARPPKSIVSSSSAKTQMVNDKFAAQKTDDRKEEFGRTVSGDDSVQEATRTRNVKAKVEGDGFMASKVALKREDEREAKIGDTTHTSRATAKSIAEKLKMEGLEAEKSSFSAQKEHRQVSGNMIKEERSMRSSSSSTFVSTSTTSTAGAKGAIMSGGLLSIMNGKVPTEGRDGESPKAMPMISEPFSDEALNFARDVGVEFELLDELISNATPKVTKANSFKEPMAIKKMMFKDKSKLNSSMTRIESKMSQMVSRLKEATTAQEKMDTLRIMNEMMTKAWNVENVGDDLGFNLSNLLRNSGGLQIILNSCDSEQQEDENIRFLSAQLLEQILTSENRNFVVEHGLDTVINVATECIASNSVVHVRVGTGVLQHMMKHSEETCKEIIAQGGLRSILNECRNTDQETLRHCAAALVNLALYGGSENQQAMIGAKGHHWLFPLAFLKDDNIKYYAILAIAALVANKEIEAAVIESGVLDLVEPFILDHVPEKFAMSSKEHIHGQSKEWLARLVPVLDSKREEARSLAAFHFAMEAWIKKNQGQTAIFKEIGAIEPLKKVASSPNALASKYAAQALRLIGEEPPPRLSQQVPLWSVDDVLQWVKQIGFGAYSAEFARSRVDGDLLLQLNDEMLSRDIGISNGILRKRFLRELANLKRITDYSSVDHSNLREVLHSLGPEFAQYAYSLIMNGATRETLCLLTEDQLERECRIDNSIHRRKLANYIQEALQSAGIGGQGTAEGDKPLDAFISYRRSNGSQLASLLKVHLQLRGFAVFIDVERLEAGKFDSNLLTSIQSAKNFILVLTPNALDRCKGDKDCKDWVHREILEAIKCGCNIIPVMDNFDWPEPDSLPKDIRSICYFNGVRWIHDYQEACVDKLERFIRGELSSKVDPRMGQIGSPTPSTPQIGAFQDRGPLSRTLRRDAEHPPMDGYKTK